MAYKLSWHGKKGSDGDAEIENHLIYQQTEAEFLVDLIHCWLSSAKSFESKPSMFKAKIFSETHLQRRNLPERENAFCDVLHLAGEDGEVKPVHRIEISRRSSLIGFHNLLNFLVKLQHVDMILGDIMEMAH